MNAMIGFAVKSRRRRAVGAVQRGQENIGRNQGREGRKSSTNSNVTLIMSRRVVVWGSTGPWTLMGIENRREAIETGLTQWKGTVKSPGAKKRTTGRISLSAWRGERASSVGVGRTLVKKEAFTMKSEGKSR